MYGLMKGGPEIDVQNCAGLKSTCRTVSTSWRAAPSWATLPPHQLALAMISVWNAEVADLNARRKSGRAIGPLFAEVGFRLRILDDDGRLGGVILPPRKVPLQVLRRTLEASGNKRRSLAIPHGRPHAVGCGLDRAGAGSSATRTGPGLERSAATEALPRGSHLSGGAAS